MSPIPPRHLRKTPWYASLNQPPRSPSHGQHRRPTSTPNSDPAGASGAGDDGANALLDPNYGAIPIYPRTTIRTRLPSTSFRTVHTGIDPSMIAVDPAHDILVAQMQKAMMDMIMYGKIVTTGVDFTKFAPEPPTIPYHGVVTGELIGHRLWYITDRSPLLCSLAHFHLWEPGKIETGDTKAVVSHGSPSIYGGIYTFDSDKNERLHREITQELLERDCRGDFGTFCHAGSPCPRLTSLVLGTVHLWGDVITHEHGYRASHAKVRSIDRVWGVAGLRSLQRLYGTNLDDRSRPNHRTDRNPRPSTEWK